VRLECKIISFDIAVPVSGLTVSDVLINPFSGFNMPIVLNGQNIGQLSALRMVELIRQSDYRPEFFIKLSRALRAVGIKGGRLPSIEVEWIDPSLSQERIEGLLREVLAAEPKAEPSPQPEHNQLRLTEHILTSVAGLNDSGKVTNLAAYGFGLLSLDRDQLGRAIRAMKPTMQHRFICQLPNPDLQLRLLDLTDLLGSENISFISGNLLAKFLVAAFSEKSGRVLSDVLNRVSSEVIVKAIKQHVFVYTRRMGNFFKLKRKCYQNYRIAGRIRKNIKFDEKRRDDEEIRFNLQKESFLWVMLWLDNHLSEEKLAAVFEKLSDDKKTSCEIVLKLVLENRAVFEDDSKLLSVLLGMHSDQELAQVMSLEPLEMFAREIAHLGGLPDGDGPEALFAQFSSHEHLAELRRDSSLNGTSALSLWDPDHEEDRDEKGKKG